MKDCAARSGCGGNADGSSWSRSTLAPWASRRRRDLLELLDRLNPTIAELSQAIEQEVEKCPEAKRLRTHPGVGAVDRIGLRADHRQSRALSGAASRWRAIWDWFR